MPRNPRPPPGDAIARLGPFRWPTEDQLPPFVQKSAGRPLDLSVERIRWPLTICERTTQQLGKLVNLGI